MPIIGELTEFYREEGIELCAGLAPSHAEGLSWAPFTWFWTVGSDRRAHKSRNGGRWVHFCGSGSWRKHLSPDVAAWAGDYVTPSSNLLFHGLTDHG